MRTLRAYPDGKHAPNGREGMALIIVLLVLLALLVLCAPFLLSARNADRASSEHADRAQAHLMLDAAARHARAILSESHPSVDKTPYWDSLEELSVSTRFPEGFLDADDPKGQMWGAEVIDIAGRIDLDSANPEVIANLIGASTRFAAAITAKEKELSVSSTQGFAPSGFVWCEGELVRYGKLGDGALVDFTRGVSGPNKAQDWRGGPKPASDHGAGAAVIDQRAFAPVLWRCNVAGGEPRRLEAIEVLRECAAFVLADATKTAGAPSAWDEDLMAPLRASGSVHGGVRAGPVWRHAARVSSPVHGGTDGRITVDNARWFNPGSTVRIRDGQTSELALVTEVGGDGFVYLDRVLANDYEAFHAELSVLARRPVNINTASRAVLEALFKNLQLRGRNARITRDEASAVATLVIQSRPLTGMEDFLKRVVLPAGGIEKLPADAPLTPDVLLGGQSIIDTNDAIALYVNGLDANDGMLAYSTMPYCFRSRDVYAFELRATVNAPSGIERFSLVREEVDLVAPQRDLFTLWARQDDFDEELRLCGEAPYWMSGPKATSFWDAGASPPSRLGANWGMQAGKLFVPGDVNASSSSPDEIPPTAQHIFASREPDAWVQLWPARTYETARLKGRILHFDHETRDPEGRFLPDEVVSRAANDKQVRWVGPSGLALPLSFSMWIKPKSLADGTLFDVSASSAESDRIALLFEKGDLVLRVLDAVGNHPWTTELEAGEARFALNKGDKAPGMPADVWSHVSFDVRGTRPDQIHMLVNGLAHGVRTPGLTRLASAIQDTTTQIAVESVEGFPAQGVVRIAGELIEYRLGSGNVLDATPQLVGPQAGFGGRVARETHAGAPPGRIPLVLVNAQASVGAHPSGALVELYGYSTPLQSNAPSGNAALGSHLGAFAVGTVTKVDLQQGSSQPGEAITLLQFPIKLGDGLEGNASQGTALELAAADPAPMTAEKLMDAFDPNGGYAVIVQRNPGTFTYVQNPNQQGQTSSTITTVHGSPIFGAEIVHYLGWQGTKLNLDTSGRGDALGLTSTGVAIGKRHAFVVKWENGITVMNNNQAISPNLLLDWKVFVIPISISASGAGGATAFLPPINGISEFAQITHENSGELTEWLRYDEIKGDRLLRVNDAAIQAAYEGATRQGYGKRDPATGTAPPPPPGGGSGGNLPMVSEALEQGYSQGNPAAYWYDELGQPETYEGPISRAVRTYFQFRGVMGTYSHAHDGGTPVLPVFRVARGSLDSGRMGPLDAAFVVDATPTDLGVPTRVHHAYQATDFVRTPWIQGATPLIGVSGASEVQPLQSLTLNTNAIFVGLTKSLKAVVPSGSVAGANGASTNDIRLISRISKHPSGERPRQVSQVRIGGGASGTKGGAVPVAVVDELVFGDVLFASKTPIADPESVQGAQLLLDLDLDAASTDMRVEPKMVRIPAGDLSGDYRFLGETPDDAGLLRIGDEILCYVQRDPSSGALTLATNGRGLLGTRPGFHAAGEAVQFLENYAVSFLASGVGAGDSKFTLAKPDEFPPEGTVLIDSELIHYTRLRDGALEMPRASSVPGKSDERGEGLFRGRFGSSPAGHASGAPVILFPIRYWDRYAARADAPELAYFQFSSDQPSGWFQSFFFQKTDGEGSQIGVLERTDASAPWDADPEKDKRLQLFWKGDVEGKEIPIGVQSDRVDWRVFVKYAPLAFDAKTGLSHAWKQTPRLSKLGVFSMQPNAVLRSVER